MNIATIIMASLTILLLLCQLMCGLWIKAKGADEAGKKFHATLGIWNVLTGLVTSVLAIIAVA
jgi:hypothetical protein